MSTSDRIRRAALSRSHAWANGLLVWYDADPKGCAAFIREFTRFIRSNGRVNRTERRMFLLFVAEALDGQHTE